MFYISLLNIFSGLMYTDITVDLKGRILLLDVNNRAIEIFSSGDKISLDSIFNPVSITASSFSVWVTTSTRNATQKYSFYGDYMGGFSLRGNDIDIEKDRLLITGESSFLINLSSGSRIPVSRKNMHRCAIGENHFYLYGSDTLYKYGINGRLIEKSQKKRIRDITYYNSELAYLRGDSLILPDTVLYVEGAKRIDSGGDFLYVLSPSGIFRYPDGTID